MSRTLQAIDRGLTRFEERLRQGSHALGRRLLAASPVRSQANLDSLVASFARARGADPLGPRTWGFHTAYGPVRVEIVHAGPRDADIHGRFTNPLGRERAREDLLCGAQGQFRIRSSRGPRGDESGLLAWVDIMERAGAAKAHSPSRRATGTDHQLPGRGRKSPRQRPRPGLEWDYRPPHRSTRMTRKTLEKLAWLRTHKDYRSSKSPPAVLMLVEGATHLVPLASLKIGALKKYARSVGIKT